MIGYCPLEDDPPPTPPPPTQQQEIRKPLPSPPQGKLPETQGMGFEDTECNYVVMFFVIGVIVLAVMDSVQK